MHSHDLPEKLWFSPQLSLLNQIYNYKCKIINLLLHKTFLTDTDTEVDHTVHEQRIKH